MPWLYYDGQPTDRILTDPAIQTKFTFPEGRLKFKSAKFTLNGTFLGLADIVGGDLQLCKASQSSLDAAFVFGTSYFSEVSCLIT